MIMSYSFQLKLLVLSWTFALARQKIPFLSRQLNWGDPQEYNDAMDFLYNVSDMQHATYLIDCFQLPFVTFNPSIMNWRFDDAENKSDYPRVLIEWPTKNGANFMKMTTGRTQDDWEVLFHSATGIEVFDGPNGENRRPFKGGDGRLYAIGNDLRLVYVLGQPFYLSFADIQYNSDLQALYVHNVSTRMNIEHEKGFRAQKNWSPFFFRDMPPGIEQNLFIYSIAPHVVVFLNETVEEGTRNAHTVAVTETIREENGFQVPLWGFGEPRGGTPALLISTRHGPKYLTFFHSQDHWSMDWIKTYYIGAYLFDPDPPFSITHITPQPVIPRPLYTEETAGWAFKSIDYILFPVGLIESNGTLFLTLGFQDNQGWVVIIDTAGLVSTMIPVKSRVLENRFHRHVTYDIQPFGSRERRIRRGRRLLERR